MEESMAKKKEFIYPMHRLRMVWLALCIWLCAMAMLSLPAIAADTGEDHSTVENETHTAQSVEAIRYAKVVTGKGTLNMRADATDDAKVLKKIPNGSIVNILADQDDWTIIFYERQIGFVKTCFLDEVESFPFSLITSEDEGEAVLAFKRTLHKLDYLKSDDINKRFDSAMEKALIKLQLVNGVTLNPDAVTPELQQLIEWGMISKGKSGYLDTATDKDSGLTVSIFCWDTDGMLYEKDNAVKIEITFAAQATGGVPPYTVTVKKSIGASGAQHADVVTSPFSHISRQDSEYVYLYAIAVDAAGNTVTACTPFRYTMPERYTSDG